MELNNVLMKVIRCIHSSNTIEQLNTTRRYMDNFFRLYEVDITDQIELNELFDTQLSLLKGNCYDLQN